MQEQEWESMQELEWDREHARTRVRQRACKN